MSVKKIKALIPDLWLETEEPWDEETLQEYWDDFGGSIPADVAAFYSITDGGEIPELECRFYGLEEAAEIAEHVNEIHTAMPLMPVFESSGEASDPVCLLLEPGLAGAVVQFNHDGDARVHAISFYEFLKCISEYDDGPLAASQHTFCFPKKLNKKEKAIADKLVRRSKKKIDPNSECINAEHEPELFQQLATSMPLAKSKSKVLDPFTYNNGRARRDAALKLHFKGTPEAKAKLAEYCKVIDAFGKDLTAALAKEGTKIKIEKLMAGVQTGFMVYRDRKVLVDDIYSTAKGKKRWDLARQWIEDMDELLDAYGFD